MQFRRVASLKTHADFQARIRELGISIPCDESVDASGPLAQPFVHDGIEVGNRFCILPMEGWDGTTDGKPSELTYRRWRNFGASGAKLIWGAEAVAVRHDGRANPNQLVITEENVKDLRDLRSALVDEHAQRFGNTDDLFVGLQLTHSGRFARPNEKGRTEPRIAYRHPVLDEKVGADDSHVFRDDELHQLIDDFVVAAERALHAGFAFVDIKHCHGYLGHELLSAVSRTGPFGGSFENRTRFLREIATRIRTKLPSLRLGVRLSAFDFPPFQKGADGVGIPNSTKTIAFGGDETGNGIDLAEPIEFVRLMRELGMPWLCVTAGSPYYTPHIQRPAAFPPSDGYLAPEDPLVGVARQIAVAKQLKAAVPEVAVVGSGLTYLQDWFANAAQALIGAEAMDFAGLGRMVLSYPTLPADVLAGKVLDRKKICRTFSDCTTAPRNGLISGCYPLDPFYKSLSQANELAEIKRRS